MPIFRRHAQLGRKKRVWGQVTFYSKTFLLAKQHTLVTLYMPCRSYSRRGKTLPLVIKFKILLFPPLSQRPQNIAWLFPGTWDGSWLELGGIWRKTMQTQKLFLETSHRPPIWFNNISCFYLWYIETKVLLCTYWKGRCRQDLWITFLFFFCQTSINIDDLHRHQ